MFEPIKEFDEDTIIMEHITPMSMDNTTSLQDDIVVYLDDINDLLIIEAGVTKKGKNGQLKEENVYLLNNTKEFPRMTSRK